MPQISLTQLIGKKPREISIEISEESLQKHRITFQQIAQAINQNSMDIPGGAIETGYGEILIRSKGQEYDVSGFASIPIVSRSDGSNLLLGDIAKISDGFADIDLYQNFNGKPAILVRVFRVGDQNALEVAGAIKSYVKKTATSLPEGVEIGTFSDESVLLKGRIDLLTKNAYLGLVLVAVSYTHLTLPTICSV